MSYQEVLSFVIGLFRRVNAVDSNLSDDEIAQIKLPDLAWFDMQLDADPDARKDALFNLLVRDFREQFGGITPVISPADGRVFDFDATVSWLAEDIANNT